MSTRLMYLLGFLIVSFLVAMSVYLQVKEGIIPCPLCILQRISFGLLGLLFLIGLLLAAQRWCRLLINFLSFLTAGIGIAFAGRQIWLQHFQTNNGGECGVSLQYMMKVLPLSEVMQKVFAGSAECSQRGWEFLSLNMAEWAFIWFTVFLLSTGYLFLKDLIKR